MASEEMFQAINKHAMGDRSEFDALKERFASTHYMSGPAAGALGYLIAKDELEAKKEEEEEEELDVYDEAVEVIKKYCHRPNNNSPRTATDKIFTLIHKWLNKELTKVVYRDGGVYIADVNLLFQPFIIEKPKA